MAWIAATRWPFRQAPRSQRSSGPRISTKASPRQNAIARTSQAQMADAAEPAKPSEAERRSPPSPSRRWPGRAQRRPRSRPNLVLCVFHRLQLTARLIGGRRGLRRAEKVPPISTAPAAASSLGPARRTPRGGTVRAAVPDSDHPRVGCSWLTCHVIGRGQTSSENCNATWPDLRVSAPLRRARPSARSSAKVRTPDGWGAP
jgi:hypothetical protein